MCTRPRGRGEPRPSGRLTPLPVRSFVVDAADQNNLEIARSELHNLLKKQDGKENPLAGIPLLVRRLRLRLRALAGGLR